MSDKTEDGYILVPKREEVAIKGIKCGQCGMKFDHNKAYGFCCMNSNCPIQNNPTCGTLA